MTSTRAAAWLAWPLAGLSFLMAVASAALFVLAGAESVSAASADDLLVFVSFMAFPVVGALISSKRPRHPIGWICLVAGLFWMLTIFSEAYSHYGLAVPGSLPFPVTIHALFFSWLWVPTVGLIGIYTVLLFPDGRLPSRRWHPLVWVAGVVIVVESVAVFLTPGPLMELDGARNPFGLVEYPWVEVVGWIFLPLLPLCMVASAASLVLRFRRAGGEVRQQIKWLAFAASFMGLVYLALMTGGLIDQLLSPPGTTTELNAQSWWGVLLENVMLLSFAGVPIAIGFAVLKHNLYDIDRIINHTLVYGVLTATLAGVYLGSVVALQQLFRDLSGGDSQLAVVASTLAIAMLFNPLRHRIQSFVDRSFYRKKYDAKRTLETFSERLREEMDLQTLDESLVRTVQETMQPEHISLWLRFSEERRPG